MLLQPNKQTVSYEDKLGVGSWRGDSGVVSVVVTIAATQGLSANAFLCNPNLAVLTFK